MKTKIITLALFAFIGMFVFTSCGGSDAYKKMNKALDNAEKNIKNAKSCDDLTSVFDVADVLDMSDNFKNMTPEEMQKISKRQTELEKLVEEKEKKLCKDND